MRLPIDRSCLRFRALNVAVMERVYSTFDIPDEAPGYLPLAVRKQIIEHSAAEVRRMIPVFDAGHVLLLLERYGEAGRCFDFVARTFASREILNNAAVARVLQALQLFEEGELPFAYPIELDATTRLRSGEKASGLWNTESFTKRRVELLEEAREILETARRRDRNYAPALVNLACVADVLDERDEALLLAERAVALAERNNDVASLSNALVIRGIARFRSGPSEEANALKDLERAAAAGSPLAAANLDIVARGRRAGSIPKTAILQHWNGLEEIGGYSRLSFDAVVTDPDAVAAVEKVSRDQPAIDIYVRREDSWSSLVIETRYSTVTVVATEEGYEGRTLRGIALGSSVDELLDAYGHPDRTVLDRNGVYSVYDDEGILFLTGEGQQLRRWMVYGIVR